MVMELDIGSFIHSIRATKPPYHCPHPNCSKFYKSYTGIQHHLHHYDHDNPPDPPGNTPKSGSKPKKKGGSKNKDHHRSMQRSPSPPDQRHQQSHTRESLSFKESQRMVEITMGGETFCVDVYQNLEVVIQDDSDSFSTMEKEVKKEDKAVKSAQKPAKGGDNGKSRKDNAGAGKEPAKLPEIQVKILENYIRPKKPVSQLSSYYRHIEKTADELDEEVEYDMDEEDHAWLDMMNDRRRSSHTAEVSREHFELLVDRFEKDASFQGSKDGGPSIDEDAVCSICMDGECQNSNVILFCDMCNLAVHQECYGVPYIPEGQWLCRRCLQSPSRAVDCVLCPNKGGAFKQTDDGRWAHVVCALWVPEVGFANTVFLEPIDCLERIPAARKRLTCYVCKQRGAGACIQCHKPNCYTAFHVTCAQQAGLYMKIEPDSMPAGVKKTALCDVHMTPDSEWTPMMVNCDSPDSKSGMSPDDAKAERRKKMRRARKILESRRKALPVISIPTIPENRLTEISSLVDIPKKEQFLRCLQSYWKLKRQSRFGVPLLKRLQSNHMNRHKDNKGDKSGEKQEQLQYWQYIRQNLEKVRLLTELVRKREKVKREMVNVRMQCYELQLMPLVVFLRKVLDQLEEIDTDDIFAEPVPLDEVPDYLDVVDEPMDFSTMRKKLEGMQYTSFDLFAKDFELMVKNCMDYNEDDTVYYEAAVKMEKEGGIILATARQEVDDVGYDMNTGLHLPDTSQSQHTPHPGHDGGDLGGDQSKDLGLEDQCRRLIKKLEEINDTCTGGAQSHPASVSVSPSVDPVSASPFVDPVSVSPSVDPVSVSPSVDPVSVSPFNIDIEGEEFQPGTADMPSFEVSDGSVPRILSDHPSILPKVNSSKCQLSLSLEDRVNEISSSLKQVDRCIQLLKSQIPPLLDEWDLPLFIQQLMRSPVSVDRSDVHPCTVDESAHLAQSQFFSPLNHSHVPSCTDQGSGFSHVPPSTAGDQGSCPLLPQSRCATWSYNTACDQALCMNPVVCLTDVMKPFTSGADQGFGTRSSAVPDYGDSVPACGATWSYNTAANEGCFLASDQALCMNPVVCLTDVMKPFTSGAKFCPHLQSPGLHRFTAKSRGKELCQSVSSRGLTKIRKRKRFVLYCKHCKR